MDHNILSSWNDLLSKIIKYDSIVLSTHPHPDGDGLGAEIALCYALRKLGKKVKLLHADQVPERYHFLSLVKDVEVVSDYTSDDQSWDLTIILDTNDSRLMGNLFEYFQKNSKDICFLDHHPRLKTGPEPTSGSLIDSSAASTGELVYRLLQKLDVEMDRDIAEAIYTSIVFDTQVFKFVRKSPVSHQLAAEMISYDIDPELIHRSMFGNFSKGKVRFFAKCLNEVEYFENDRFAYLVIRKEELEKFGLEYDNILDLVDFIVSVKSVEAAVVLRVNAEGIGKASFRSKTNVPILPLAESFGGGGHAFAAGSSVSGDTNAAKQKILKYFKEKF